MLKKVKQKYELNKKKRNYKLTTPCCNTNNKDGKFVNYIGLPEIYGFCHSCGKNSLPPNIYTDKFNNEYTWNTTLNTYEKTTSNSYQQQLATTSNSVANNKKTSKESPIKYIPESNIWDSYTTNNENNLLLYLRKTYNSSIVELAKELYVVGTSYDGGTIFWQINKNSQVQKSKISYYDNNGKRNNKFKVPYKNEQGYYSCLFGEHLILDKNKGKQIIILVESEKTAIVGFINLPKYTWLAYGGLTALTNNKVTPLIGHRVLLIPDISNKAVEVMKNKLPYLHQLGINASIWDMTNGKTDEQLKKEGVYNDDLEDYFRKIKTNSTNNNVLLCC